MWKFSIRNKKRATTYTEQARKEWQELGPFTLTDNYEEADVAILVLTSKIWNLFQCDTWTIRA